MSLGKRISRDNTFKQAKLEKTRGRRSRLEADRNEADLADWAAKNDLLPDLEIRQVAVAALRASPHRTRRTELEHVHRLVSSISSFGFTVPILICGDEIIDGHVRVEAADRLDLKEVSAIDISHLSPERVRALRQALNRIQELGEWDLDQLRIEFQDLIELNVDLSSIGFTREEQDIILLDPLSEEDAEEELDDPPEVPVTRIGDIWTLDDHRILCGNALDPQSYKAILDDNVAHAVLSDPPYNVKIQGNVSGLGKKVHAEFAMASGEMSDEEFQAFLTTLMVLLKSCVADGAVLFVFMDWRSIHRLYAAGFAAELKLLNLVVWYKQAGGMGALYRSSHELIAVFCKGKKPRRNHVELGRHGRDRSNTWVAPSANRRGSSANEMLEFHATPKPVELCVDAILDVTDAGETVLDAFLGSGTTLIAAEKTGRRCCGVELEPRFVDVALRRWEKLTARQAVLAVTGETFEQVAARRLAEDQDAALTSTEE